MMKRIIRYIPAILLLLALSFVPAHAEKEPEAVVSIGLLDSFNPEVERELILPTMEYLKQKFPQIRWSLVHLNTLKPVASVEQSKADFVFSSAGTFQELHQVLGYNHVVTSKSVFSDNPSESVGSVFIARKSREDLKDIPSLKGKVAVASQPNSFDGWLIGTHEIAKEGYDPDKFFSKVIFSHFQFPDSLAILAAGKADVGVFSACLLEKLEKEGLVSTEDFKIISPKDKESLKCSHSTELYPGIVLSTGENTDPKLVWEVTSALLSMPSINNSEWTISQKFSKVNQLYQDLKIGPYSYLKEQSLSALWQRFKNVILIIAGIVLILIVNEIYLRSAVAWRTRQLKSALKEKIRAERDAREKGKQLAQMEKFGVISQMSGMLAHELQQPLLAIGNFTSGLKMYMNKQERLDKVSSEAIQHIEKNTKRIADIVGRVRSYAKNKRGQFELVDLAEIAKRALTSAKGSAFADIPIRLKVPAKAEVYGQPLELELIMVNLLKNACSEVKKVKDPQIVLSIEDEGKCWRVSVRDNGPKLSPQEFLRLRQMGDSVKDDGLGIGLSLVRGLCDSHGASLSFSQIELQGICAAFVIEKRSDDGADRKNN